MIFETAGSWDKPCLEVGQVFTSTSGSVGSRRYTVQWNNVRDNLGSADTYNYEAVLFEGSNDIQFLYSSMSGPRSDASSATIGVQDLPSARMNSSTSSSNGA